jgi:hypothetical protein
LTARSRDEAAHQQQQKAARRCGSACLVGAPRSSCSAGCATGQRIHLYIESALLRTTISSPSSLPPASSSPSRQHPPAPHRAAPHLALRALRLQHRRALAAPFIRPHPCGWLHACGPRFACAWPPFVARRLPLEHLLLANRRAPSDKLLPAQAAVRTGAARTSSGTRHAPHSCRGLRSRRRPHLLGAAFSPLCCRATRSLPAASTSSTSNPSSLRQPHHCAPLC